MTSNYLQVWISAEDRKQADKILNSLLDKKLVIGGQIIMAPARFWWKGKIVNMNYIGINTFTKKQNKEKIIDDIKKTSVEEVPMISFVEFEGNKEFTDFIDETLK